MGGSAPRRDLQLPVETTSFVDRRGELTEGRELLARARLVTLTGPGGVGKTRLAARIAARVARAFPDGVRFVHLSGLHDPALVPLAAGDALGLHDHSAQPPLDALVEQVRRRRLLLVVDNCEHVLGACAELAAALLRGTTGVRLLATSRHRLGLTEEHLLEVRPLPVPDPDGDLSAAEGYPALTLFADRAAAVVPGFRLTPDNRAAVARLCHRLDGLPLAIELAAVRMRVLGIEQLLERLDDRYRLLSAGSPAVLPRHQTLRAAVDWSHDLCTEREQLVWARLSVTAGSFDLETAEAVCADEEDAAPGPSTDGATPGEGGADGLRASEARADGLGTGPGALDERAEGLGTGPGALGERAEGLGAGAGTGGVPADARPGTAHVGGPAADARPGSARVGDPAADALPRSAPPDDASDTRTRDASPGGAVGARRAPRILRPDVLEAVAGLVDKSVLCREPGPGGVRYRLLDTLRQYGLDRLRRLPGEEAAARRRLGNWMLRRAADCERTWFGPGQPETVARLRADQDNLRAVLDHSLSTPDEALAGLRLAGTLWFYWHACGAPREGRYWIDRALDAGPEPTRERARGLWVAGLLAAVTQDLSRGHRLAEEARALARTLGDAAEEAHAEYVVGVIRLFRDDLPGALDHFEASVARGPVPGQHLSIVGLDQVELACALGFLGEADRAVEVCERALRLCEEHGEEWVRSYVLRMLALARTVQQDWPSAERHARESVRLKLAVHDVTGIALTLDLLALIATRCDAHERAAVLLGGADRVWTDIDRNRWGSTALNSARRDSEARIRAAVGRRDYERAYARGGGLGLAEIVGYALQEQPQQERHRAERSTGTDRLSDPAGVRLTRRETEVARLVAEGLANQQIADRLVIARRTAEGHVERILSKLGFSSRSQIAAWVTAQR
ncbi:LuxR C-terminal-related transcriptional regulator [Streptomyces sp. S.PNR 29]|uniref:ATP-binding protein n=1 Tax=Streptomyces sp. S.PNR 29 TaxID=2973805 RepID=UPI0025B2687C|nr:LuxR C-terminal-related transcriptional regulator [Streptomyces sp. S.PNR 29]MDN0195435.1 LuxR C-terminal-related transcriptional regulator [Streptomyces sp. S.PNR 29]